MGVYELSGAGSLKTPRTVYSSMNANNQFGAMVPLQTYTFPNSTMTGLGFSNIPQTYQDLMLVVNYSTTVSLAPALTINAGGFTYSLTSLQGNGSSALSARITNYPFGLLTQLGCSTTTPNTSVTHILNYANTSTFKTAITRNAMDANGSGSTDLVVNLFQTTSAINAVGLSTANGGYFFTTGSTATLYGIRAVSS